jgi:HK97 family phage portal protein
MNTYDFIYKTITQLYLTNNAFVYVMPDEITGKPVGFYPLNSIAVDLLEAVGDDETVYAKFYFMNGKTVVVPYADIIHLRRFYYKNDMYGETHNTALTPILQVITTMNSGIINAVKSSAYLRGLLKFTQNMMKPEDIKKQRDDFITDYMDKTNNGGVAALDAKADYTELKGDPKIIDDKTMGLVRDQVYRYFNISEAIHRGYIQVVVCLRQWAVLLARGNLLPAAQLIRRSSETVQYYSLPIPPHRPQV